MDKNKAIETLNLFNEKTDELINSEFVRHMQNVGLKVTLKISTTQEPVVIHTLPNHEIIKAFVLTIRFFIQNNECSSIKNLAELYKEMPLSDGLKKDFTWARNELNEEFKKKPFLQLNGEELTHRRIFDTFIYGGLAHANKEKKEEYDKWMNDKIIAPLLMSEFYNFLLYFLNCIAYIKKINVKAMEEINSL